MTKAEIERYLEGAVWRMKTKAQFDYVLADLIGISMARIMDSKTKFPKIEDVYSSLFAIEDETSRAAKKDMKMTNSVNNFLAYAKQHNARMSKGVETIKND